VVAPIKKARPKPRLEIGWRKSILRGGGILRDDIHAAAVLVELHLAVGEREQCPVAAGADVFARDKFATALADDDAARADNLPAKFFYAQPFADAVATVANTPLTLFMCHKPEKLTDNSLDFDDRQFLAVSDGFVITLAAFHLEREFFVAANVFDHIGLDRRAGHGRRAHGEFAVAIDEQYAVESDRLARLGFETFDFQRVARRDTILFATSF
jgi:hypothetical protein